MPEISQLFIKRDCSEIVCLIVIKIVDGILCSEPSEIVRQFAIDSGNVFSFGTVSHGPGIVRFYGLSAI